MLFRWRQLGVLGAASLAVFASTLPSEAGSTGSSVVSAQVLPSVTLGSSCHDRDAWSFGTILPGAADTTSTGPDVCRFTWSSSNSGSTLRVHQADRVGAAMVGQASSHSGIGPIAEAMMRFDGRGTVYLGAGAWNGVPMRHSVDSGQGFADRAQADSYVSVSMTDAATAWRAGSSGVQRSLDANTSSPSWTDTASPLPSGGGDPSMVDATSASVAWVVKYDRAYLTTDSGSTWVSALSTPLTGNIEAASATVAFGTGWAGALHRTNDGNLSWSTAMSGIAPHVGGGVPDVSVPPGAPSTAWFVNSTGVYRSTDSGDNWTLTTALPDVLRPSTITAVSASEAYVGGDDGIVFHTTNSGLTWARFRTPASGPLQSIVALDASHVLVAEVNGPAFATLDGGSSWSVAYDNRGDAKDIAAVDRRSMVAADAFGRVRTTNDHGSSWTTRSTPVAPWPVRGVAMHGSGEADGTEFLLVVGDAGRIAQSFDGGASWSDRSTASTDDLWDVDVASDGVAIAVGANGTILRSTDWGGTWSSEGGAGSTLRHVDIHDDGTVVAVGHGGTIRHSVDAGSTWTSPASGVATDLVSLSRPSTEVVYAAGDARLLKSVDGGLTWATMAAASSLPTSVVAASTDSTVWLFEKGWQGWSPTWAMRSVDGGQTFGAAFAAYSPHTSSALAFGTGRVWVGGIGGEMRMTDPAPEIDDYASGDWAGGSSRFGMCLQAIGGSAALANFDDVDDGTCAIDDGDQWYGVPTAPSKLGQMATAGTGSVDLVWGMRAGSSQAPGEYSAAVTITAVAPNA